MKILKNIWAGLTKKYGDRESDRRHFFWFVAIVGVLSVTQLVIRLWSHATLGEYELFDAYLTATLWCAFFYAYFLFVMDQDKLVSRLMSMYRDSYANAMKGWGQALEIMREEEGYTTWLEKRVGFASEDLRKEYAATLSTTDPA